MSAQLTQVPAGVISFEGREGVLIDGYRDLPVPAIDAALARAADEG